MEVAITESPVDPTVLWRGRAWDGQSRVLEDPPPFGAGFGPRRPSFLWPSRRRRRLTFWGRSAHVPALGRKPRFHNPIIPDTIRPDRGVAQPG